MADQHATTGDAINHAIDKASEGLAQVTHLLSSSAPQAWALLVRATFAQGLVNILIGGFELVGATLLIVLSAKAGSTSWEEPKLRCFVSIFAGIAAVILLFAGLVDFCSASNWFRVVSPDGYLAQQALQKVL